MGYFAHEFPLLTGEQGGDEKLAPPRVHATALSSVPHMKDDTICRICGKTGSQAASE